MRPKPSAEQHEFDQDGDLADIDVLGRGDQGERARVAADFSASVAARSCSECKPCIAMPHSNMMANNMFRKG